MSRIRQIAGPMIERVLATRRQLATAALVCLAVWLLVHAFISPNGVMAYENKKKEFRELQKTNQSLAEQNARLAAHNEALKNNDPKAIEKEVREGLHYAKPGDVVYVLPEPKRTPAPSPTDMQSAEAQKPGR
jgi:cell division protein FtsB